MHYIYSHENRYLMKRGRGTEGLGLAGTGVPVQKTGTQAFIPTPSTKCPAAAPDY